MSQASGPFEPTGVAVRLAIHMRGRDGKRKSQGGQRSRTEPRFALVSQHGPATTDYFADRRRRDLPLRRKFGMVEKGQRYCPIYGASHADGIVALD